MATKRKITVPTSYVKHLLSQVIEQGHNVDELLSYVGVKPEDIHRANEFPADIYGQLYQRVMYVAQDEYFGMLSGGRVPNGTFRMMCHAIISCQNLGHALLRASDFHEIVRDTKVKPTLIRKGRYVKFSFGPVDMISQSEFKQLVKEVPASNIESSLSVWHHFISWLIGERVELKAAYFAFSENDAMPDIGSRFHSSVKFNQHANAIIFSSTYLDYPIVQSEKTLKGFLKTAPYQLLVMVNDNNSLKDQVMALIGRDFTLSPPGAEKVAHTLNMSISTLRRRLLEEGTTFQKIKDECRKESAIKYMNSPQLSISDVSALMGFDEPSAFFRSFKRWTGMTPGEYRESEAFRSSLNAIN